MDKNPTHTDSEAPTRPQITKAQTDAINDIARDWADYVGGFKQARKIVEEAFCRGRQFEQALKPYGHN